MPAPAPFVSPLAFRRFHFACRRSLRPVTTPSPVTGALPSRLPNLGTSRLLDFSRFRTFGGCASGEPDAVSAESAQSAFAVNVHQSLRADLIPVGAGVPSWGPPPHPGPAVHSFGNTALHSAALHGNRRIVRLLIAFNADVNVQEGSGCAFPFRHRRTLAAEPPPSCRAEPRRCTLPRLVVRPE
jgi:hypothetical protein